MKTFKIVDIIDDAPTLEVHVSEIWKHCREGGCIQVLSPLEHHTARQRAWIKGVALPTLANWSGDSVEYWDLYLKKHCHGFDLLKRDTILTDNGTPLTRLTIVGVGKKNLTQYIEEIVSHCIEHDFPLGPPDPDLRRK